MIGVVNVCVRERTPPATGSNYPSLRKIMRFSRMKKRVPWWEERNRRKEKQKKKKDRVVPGGVLEGGGQATATHPPPTQGRGSFLPFLPPESCVKEATASGGNIGQF